MGTTGTTGTMAATAAPGTTGTAAPARTLAQRGARAQLQRLPCALGDA